MKKKLTFSKVKIKILYNKKVSAVVVILILLILVGLFYQNRNKLISKDPGYQPLVEYGKELDTYYKACPLDSLFWESQKDKSFFEIVDLKCSENEAPEFKTGKKGEEANIEIHTQDFEEGKTKFIAWLKSQGLEESPTLRITFVHKPK
jgi:hypothetical protein